MNIFTIEQPSYWHCDNCDEVIWDGDYRFNCIVCEDYDYCEKCMKTVDPPHPHRMVREIAYGPPTNLPTVAFKNMATGIQKAFELYRNRHCMGVRNVDETNPFTYLDSYSWLTFKTVGDRVDDFGHGLRTLIEPRGYLGICAANRPEWLITDFACMIQSIISVPIYCLFNDREAAYVINNTQVSVIVCDKEMLLRFIQLGKECPSLRHIVCMDPIAEMTLENASENCPSLHYMGDIEKAGSMKKYEYVSIKPTDYLTIIYTSGSSGFPKGAIISEEAYRATFPYYFTPCAQDRVNFSYRSLAWAADRDAAIGAFLAGGRVGFSTGDVNRLMEELTIVRPTQFSAPPIFWNKIYAEYKAAISLINVDQSSKSKAQEEKRILKQFAKLIPNRCKRLTVGSAKISPIVFNFMKQCFRHCRINESYGITECGSVAYNNMVEGDIKYRLESVPEMGYTIDDRPYPRGEILTKTTQMFSGYINNPEETQAALTDDGFFRTGDIVELRTDNRNEPKLYIIDRKKNFFKLAQGQFVSPEFLQSIYIRSPFVEQIYIHGDLLSDSVAAVVVPNRAYAQAFALEHNLTNFDPNKSDPKFCNAVLQDLRSLAKKESLRVHEIPSQLIIDFELFTPENGLLTPSFKPCRHKLAAHYATKFKPIKTIDQRLKTIFEMATGQSLSNDDEDNLLISNGVDSLSAVRLSHMIENDLVIPIPISVLFEPTTTLQQLSTLLKNPSQLNSISHSIVPQLFNDCQLNFNITMNEYKKSAHSPSTIFLTGATGFVGAFLLAELLTVYPTNCKFICLVRSETSVNPLDRIRDTMNFYRIWKNDYQERIIPLQGDLSKPSFGLDNQTYELLANQTDIIFHCGAIVNFVLPYSKLYGSNVCGTREIIRLATYTSNYIPVQYISTVSVLPSNVDKEISIDEISPNDLFAGYAQSKWVAEKLITKASQLGLPVVIYRLGAIGSDTNTGSSNKNDIHTLLLTAMIKTGCYPNIKMNGHFNGLPADFTAKSIVYLSRNHPNVYGKVYHVLDPNSTVLFKDIIDGMHRRGLQLTCVSREEWQIKLTTIADRNDSLKTVGEFLSDGVFDDESTISAEQFCTALSSLNFPVLDNVYIDKWLNFILQNIVC